MAYTFLRHFKSLERNHFSWNLRYLELIKQASNGKCTNLHKLLRRCVSQDAGTLETKAVPQSVKKQVALDLSKFPTENVRNFSIIAHVDHGKSTLADRLLEITGTITPSKDNEQVLDKLQVERERGITVKAQSVAMFHQYEGKDYLLNLVDTPGHVDFAYEVSRSLIACQGAILLIDANQGVQAQTVANFYLAFGTDKTMIPVLNKIDLKQAKSDDVSLQMKNLFEFEPHEILQVSAKLGTGVRELLDHIVERIPPPDGDLKKPFRAHLFDSWYEPQKGVILLVSIADGFVKAGSKIALTITGKQYEVKEVGILNPNATTVPMLCAGQVGYIVGNIRSTKEAIIGDTIHTVGESVTPLPTVTPAKPMVFSGIYAMEQTQAIVLRTAIEKLVLNDASVTIAIEHSPALGQGWRIGFLGLLHMEVFTQRLEQEYEAEVILTVPSVPYKVKIKGEKNIKEYGGEVITIKNPLLLPDPSIILEYYEPMVLGTIITPSVHMGKILQLCHERRGEQKDMKNIDENVMMLQFKFPLGEVIVDFFDALKTISSGYASFDYEDYGYEIAQLVKMTFMLNGRDVEELTMIVHALRARDMARSICEKLKETIPQHMFSIAIQAAIGAKIVARENIRSIRKDVTAKLYGGDVTRRMKLLKRQATAKKAMRMVGDINLPKDTFIKVLRRS